MAKIEIELSNGAKAGSTLQELQKEASKLYKELSKLPETSDEFVKKSARYKEVSANADDLRKKIKGTAEASNILKDSFDKYIPFAGTFKMIGQEMGFVTKGVGGLTGSLGILRTALLATGIGAIVVVLGSLISYLTSTQEGMDKVTSVTRPLAALFQRFMGVVQELGGKVFKQLGNAINHPKQAFIDLGNAIKDNLLARLQALKLFGPALAKLFSKDWKEGLKDLGNATIQVTTGVKNGIDKIANAAKNLTQFVSESIAQGSKLDAMQKAIERGENKQIVRTKELQLLIKQQKDIVEDVNKSYDERRVAAERALQAQEELLKGEIRLLDQRIAKMKLEHSLNDTSREDEKALAELIAKKLEIEANVTEQRIEFKKKISEFDKAQAAEQLAIQKNLEALRLEAMEESLEKQIEQINLETEQKIQALTGSAEQILEQEKLLEEIRINQIQSIRDQAKADEAAKEKKKRDDDFAALMEDYDKKIKEAEEYEAAKRQIEIESFDAAENIQASFIDLLSTDEASRKKHAQTIKAIQVGSVTTSLAAEIAAIWEHAQKNPANAFFPAAGSIIAVVKTIAATARAGAALGRIKSAQFEKGGPLKGPSHANNGIPFTINGTPGFEAEGDEIILTKGVYRNPVLRRAASDLNYLGGGRKFASGGPINPIQPSAISGNASVMDQRSSGGMSFAANEVVDEIRGLRSEVSQWQRSLRVVNVVTETEAGIKTVNQIKADADI